MSILINKDTKVITQGITGKTGQFHTRMCRDYANGKNCFVAGVNPKKAGEDFEGIPIYASVKDAKAATGATVSVIYVPPAGAGHLYYRGYSGPRHDGGSQQNESP
jgi:succinyl-CoA synthetase alpha subunit